MKLITYSIQHYVLYFIRKQQNEFILETNNTKWADKKPVLCYNRLVNDTTNPPAYGKIYNEVIGGNYTGRLMPWRTRTENGNLKDMNYLIRTSVMKDFTSKATHKRQLQGLQISFRSGKFVLRTLCGKWAPNTEYISVSRRKSTINTGREISEEIKTRTRWFLFPQHAMQR